jgi:Type IV secretion system pilin
MKSFLRKAILISALCIAVSTSFQHLALAATPSTEGGGFGQPIGCLDIPDFGCISTNPRDIINWILSFFVGLVGGFAILLIIIGGFRIAASHGDPQGLADARGMVTAAIIGLVFVLLATAILGILGINILGLPNFQWSGSGVNIISN